MQIARHRSGRSAGFAIIGFSTHEEALRALKGADGTMHLGRKLSVKWYSPETAPQSDGTAAAAVPAVFKQQQAVAPLLDPTSTLLIEQPADQAQASLLQQLMENLQQQQLIQKPETVASSAQWPPTATSSRHHEWSSLPGSWIGDSIMVSQTTIITFKSYFIYLMMLRNVLT